MTDYIKVKDWDKLQHYKDRAPPWIKLHNSLLESYEFERLPDASKAHLMCIWMLASRTNNKIPADPEWIAKKIGATEQVNLASLVDSGFLLSDQPLQSLEHDASKLQQKVVAHRCLEREGETEREGEESREDPMSGKPDGIAEVIDHLNYVCGTKYRASTRSHAENISARLNEGHSVEDLKIVIESKHAEWSHDPRMASYLRPQTLFSVGKFQGYLTAAKVPAKKSLHDLSGQNYESGDL